MRPTGGPVESVTERAFSQGKFYRHDFYNFHLLTLNSNYVETV